MPIGAILGKTSKRTIEIIKPSALGGRLISHWRSLLSAAFVFATPDLRLLGVRMQSFDLDRLHGLC